MRNRLLALAVACASGLFAADINVIDEIIAKVNGEIISRGDIARARKLFEASARQQGLTGVRLEEAIKSNESNILRERLDNLLLLSRAKELSLSVDSEVNKQVAEIQRTSKIADPEKFQEFVKQETGQTFEDYKSEIRNQMLTNRVIRQEVASKIQFKREDQMKYYEEHKSEFQRDERVFLREIVINGEGPKKQDAEKKAKDLSARAKKGEKYEELAVANSDSQSAPQGGEIGSFVKGNLRAELEKLIWDQPRGYVTDPIPAGESFLILKVEDHQKAGLADFEEVQAEVSNKLFQPRFQPDLRKFLTQLRRDAFLEIKAGFDDSGAAPGKDTAWVDPAEIKPETITKEQVAAKRRYKRLLGVVPIPGTATQSTGVSSSR